MNYVIWYAITIVAIVYPSLTPLAATPSEAKPGPGLPGQWQSVDYVADIAQFVPGQKRWPQDLYLKELSLNADGTTSMPFTWRDGRLYAADGKTNAEYTIKEMGGKIYLFLPWLSGDVTIRGQRPWYYVLRKVSDAPAPQSGQEGPGRGAAERYPVQPATSVAPFDDVRNRDLSGLDLSRRRGLIETLIFNQKTVWPHRDKLPPGPNPEAILAAGENPGLGVRWLHRQGLTGKGVTVAIIDQPLCPNHPEFAGKIIDYRAFGCGGERTSMHGPMVLSLLAGERCGVAPGARVVYAAAASWTKDTLYQSQAMDWLVERNASLPAGQKIRVISISACPAGPGSPFTRNQDSWDRACRRAEAAGILVIDCTAVRRLTSLGWYHPKGPELSAACRSGQPQNPFPPSPGTLVVPASLRTGAEQQTPGHVGYIYWGRGGLSWTVPYAAGVLALGWERRPDLNAGQMKDLLFRSAEMNAERLKIISPKKFIQGVERAPRKDRVGQHE